MFRLVDNIPNEREFRFVRELNILEDIYKIDADIWVIFRPGIQKGNGDKARGAYARGQIPATGMYDWHIIFIDDKLDIIEAATVLIHEYAHILSQQNHEFTMYELWRSYLRQEFRRRWKDVIGEEDTDDDRGRIVVVGKVCSGGIDEHLQELDSGSGQTDCENECAVRGSGRSTKRRCPKHCKGD